MAFVIADYGAKPALTAYVDNLYVGAAPPPAGQSRGGPGEPATGPGPGVIMDDETRSLVDSMLGSMEWPPSP